MRTSPTDRKEAGLAVSPAKRVPFKKEYGSVSKRLLCQWSLPFAKEIRPCDCHHVNTQFRPRVLRGISFLIRDCDLFGTGWFSCPTIG